MRRSWLLQAVQHALGGLRLCHPGQFHNDGVQWPHCRSPGHGRRGCWPRHLAEFDNALAQILCCCATHATVCQLDLLRIRRLCSFVEDQRVNVDGGHIIDNDSEAHPVISLQKVLQQRGLTCAKEAGQQDHRNALCLASCASRKRVCVRVHVHVLVSMPVFVQHVVVSARDDAPVTQGNNKRRLQYRLAEHQVTHARRSAALGAGRMAKRRPMPHQRAKGLRQAEHLHTSWLGPPRCSACQACT
mmetsp:Transcript_38788/g.76882  ORF Transcript_38788/g.76882 Transcript_38788/m.76882 type:complete len:244 (+) Transcript_38788:1110-1841(+)